jgi:predicted acyltransferase
LEGKPIALKTYVYDTFFGSLASGPHAICSAQSVSLLWALMYVTGLYLVAYVMYRRKWFLKV